ncbi:unnamed protein product [Linum trigynum]|uniref:Uncharacterized protein n=1 Tax=Linum trigynum TaxID=586398 RepID=A0AAV2CW41_9ROSI
MEAETPSLSREWKSGLQRGFRWWRGGRRIGIGSRDGRWRLENWGNLCDRVSREEESRVREEGESRLASQRGREVRLAAGFL